MAAVFYIGYRVKNAVVETARERGVDLDKITSNTPAARRVDPCSLLTAQEASEILQATIERTESRGDDCHYFGKPSEVKPPDLSKLPEPGKDQQANLRQVEKLTKELITAATGGGAYLSITVEWENGRVLLGATKLFSAAQATDNRDLQGIGDDAVFGPMNSILVFTKGATGVQIDLRMVPEGREKGIALAKTILKRL